MKKKLIVLCSSLVLLSCTTDQMSQTASVVDPIVNAMASAYAQQYGIPPTLTTAVATTLENQAWGMAAKLWAKQPAATGTTIPAVAAAATAKLPTLSTSSTKAQIMEAVANQLAAVASTPTTP